MALFHFVAGFHSEIALRGPQSSLFADFGARQENASRQFVNWAVLAAEF